MSDQVIKVEGLGKRYALGGTQSLSIADFVKTIIRPGNKRNKEDFWALKDINFEIHRGEAIGIIGRNGAGKSTLLKVLSRITHPTTGRIEMQGRVASLLEVGTGFHPELSGRENIFLNGTILGMTRSEIKEKFDEIVAFSGVEKFVETPVKHYSSGMYVRLAFSVAAHLEPEILIIDEVLAVGDAEFQKKCLGKMGEVAKQGRTVLFVSHNLNAVKKLCNRGIVLNAGKIEYLSDNMYDVIERYQSGFDDDSEKSHKISVEKDFEYLRIDSFYLEKQTFTYQEEILITIEGCVNIPDRELNLGLKVFNQDELLLFSANTMDQGIDLTRGSFNLKFRIPKHLLNAGKYTIELIGDLRYKVFVIQPGDLSRLSFRVEGDFPWSLPKHTVLAPSISILLE